MAPSIWNGKDQNVWNLHWNMKLNNLCNCNYVKIYNMNSYLGEIQQHLIDIVLTLFHENL